MKRNGQRYRIVGDRIFYFITLIFSFLALIPLVSLVLILLTEGIRHLNFESFFTSESLQIEVMLAQLAGENNPGGIANGILGGLYIICIALVMAVPLGLFFGVFLYSKRTHPLVNLFSHANNILLGVPTIITGLIVYLWIVRSLHGYSALAGGIAIAFVMFPIISRSTFQTLSKLPLELTENSAALGISYSRTILRVLIPSAKREIAGHILQAATRGLGETAPLLFTALGASIINWHINRPTSTLSLQIWNFFNNPYLIHLMWSAAFILFVIIFLFHIAAKVLIGNKKLHRYNE